MLEYYSIAACFIDLANSETKAARDAIREALGVDVVKKGWTHASSVKALDLLGDVAINHVCGRLLSIKTHTNKDEKTGNEYPKIRVELSDVRLLRSYKNEQGRWALRESSIKPGYGGTVILSLEAGQEFAHRLVAKLSAVKPGDSIDITGFAKAAERDGRTFADHIASVKNDQGKEITSLKDYFAMARQETRELEATLTKLGLDAKSIKSQVKVQKTRIFLQIAADLGKGMPEIVPTRKSSQDEVADRDDQAAVESRPAAADASKSSVAMDRQAPADDLPW